MSKRRHDQKGDAPTFVCGACKQDQCNGCIDVLRSVYSQQAICNCRRKNHSGEPRNNQIADPFTGSVFGPGLEVPG